MSLALAITIHVLRTLRLQHSRARKCQLIWKVRLLDNRLFVLPNRYTRCELNIRITANWMLAVASLHHEARRFLKAYFSKSIRLPTDWIEVAQLVHVAGLSSPPHAAGSLPAALRKAMVAKFSDFDEYVLHISPVFVLAYCTLVAIQQMVEIVM